jgi:hypothetical protein
LPRSALRISTKRSAACGQRLAISMNIATIAAIFLRLYYIMTLEVHAAVNQLGDYKRQIFLDPAWIVRLSGLFASLYFRSLDTFERDPSLDVERAWKIAYKTAEKDHSTVLQNALLGINAHINYDLPYAIAKNLREHDDVESHLKLKMRKFDHDQVNNLLIRAIDPIQDVLAQDYGEAISLVDRMLGQLDEKISETRLAYYRERVWWDAMSFVSAVNDGQEDIVRAKLNWESYKVAQILTGRSPWQWGLWIPERLLGIPGRLLGKRGFDGIVLEKEGGVPTSGKATISPLL